MAKVAVVTFTDPRKTALIEEREKYNRECHEWLIQQLKKRGFEVIDGNEEFRNREFFGIASMGDVRKVSRKITDADVMVFGCWHWADMMHIVALVRDVKKPVALFTRQDPAWAGATCVSSAGASLWESSANEQMLRHERFIEDVDELAAWIRGVSALEKLKRSTLLLLGGSYCLHMEHLRDDFPFLKTFLVGEIDEESEYLIIKRAEEIDAKRIDRFIQWFKENGGTIKYGGILDEESLRKQVALYLATKDLINERKDVAGISIRCQPELSEVYGVTGCLIPAFMPYHVDSEGEKRIIPTVCEGDLKGLITATLLYFISGEPPLFGDLKYVDDGLMVIANCGASSVYHACHSRDVKKCLSRVQFQSQCQGKAGAAVTYRTPPAIMTVCRLARIGGRYVMQIALGRAREITEEDEKSLKWGATWPHTFIEIPATRDEIISSVASNHFIAVTGDITAEVEYACAQAGIEVEWIGSYPYELVEEEYKEEE